MHARRSQSKKRIHTAPGSVAEDSPFGLRTCSTRSGNFAATLCIHSHAKNIAEAGLCIHSPIHFIKNLPLCMHSHAFSANNLSLCSKKRSFWTKVTRISPRQLNKNP
jgi:hypothetical protein